MRDILNFVKFLIKRYFIDSFYLNLPQLIGIFTALITLPIILANLPIKDYGIFQFVLGLQLWLVALTGGHITLGAKRGISKGLEGTFLFAFFYRLKFLVIIGTILFISSFFIYNAGLITLSLLLVLVSIFLILGYLPQVSYLEFFIAKKQFKNFATWQIVTLVLTTGSVTAAAFFTHNILMFAIVQFGLTTLIGWLGFLYVIKKNNLILAYKKGEIDKECVPYGIKLIPAALILETSNRITNFIIGPFFGFSNLAVFSVAYKIEEKLRNFMKSFHNLLYSDFAKDEQRELIKKTRERLKKVLIVSVILTLGFLFLTYMYVDLFLPESYQMTKLYFLILSLALPGVFSQIIMHTILAAHLRYKELTVLGIVPNLLKIVLILIFGYFWKIIGICFALAISGWISFGFYYFLTLKREVVIKFINDYPKLKRFVQKY